MYELAAAGGKFQPLHREHVDYLLGAAGLTRQLIVGITNPDEHATKPERLDSVRGRADSNFASYYERLLMVTGALTDAGVSRARFEVVPFPISSPEVWPAYVPARIPFIITLFADDPWLLERRRRIEQSGHPIHVLRSSDRKGVEGREVRRRIVEGGDWRSLVPPATASVIKRFALDDRLMAMHHPRSADDP